MLGSIIVSLVGVGLPVVGGIGLMPKHEGEPIFADRCRDCFRSLMLATRPKIHTESAALPYSPRSASAEGIA
jgi:hypothetical protein